MHGKVDELNEKKTKGRGGARHNAGRPVGSTKEPTTQIRVPCDIAVWLKQPGIIYNLRNLMQAYIPNITQKLVVDCVGFASKFLSSLVPCQRQWSLAPDEKF